MESKTTQTLPKSEVAAAIEAALAMPGVKFIDLRATRLPDGTTDGTVDVAIVTEE